MTTDTKVPERKMTRLEEITLEVSGRHASDYAKIGKLASDKQATEVMRIAKAIADESNRAFGDEQTKAKAFAEQKAKAGMAFRDAFLAEEVKNIGWLPGGADGYAVTVKKDENGKPVIAVKVVMQTKAAEDQVRARFNTAWAKHADAFGKLAESSATLTLSRKPDGTLALPSLVIGTARATVAKGEGRGRGGRGQPVTVSKDGAVVGTYPSFAAAKVALLPGKADASMSGKSVTSALATAGYTVNAS